MLACPLQETITYVKEVFIFACQTHHFYLSVCVSAEFGISEKVQNITLFSRQGITKINLIRNAVRQISQEIYLHITFDGKNTVLDRFWGHPFHRKLFRVLSAVHVLVDFSHQPKVRHFDSVITANQNITSCKITMNEAFLCEMILKNHEIIKKSIK